MVESKPVETPKATTGNKDTTQKPKETKAPPKETQPPKSSYTPIPEGWTYIDSGAGSMISSAQKAQLDEWAEVWRRGNMSDDDLYNKIENLLKEGNISYNLIIISYKDRFISDHVPDNPVEKGGLPYVYKAIYSTGKENEETGSETTVFYLYQFSIL